MIVIAMYKLPSGIILILRNSRTSPAITPTSAHADGPYVNWPEP